MLHFFSIVPPFFKKLRSNYFSPIFLILVVALLLRLPRMGESLWLDELTNTHWYMPDAFNAIVIMLLREHLPISFGLMFGWINLFGDSEWSVRMPSLMSGLFSILLTYWVAIRCFGKKYALLPALLAALSCVHIWYSTESRPYAILLMLLLASLLAYWNLRERTHLSGWDLVYFILSFAMIFTHLYMSLYVIAFLWIGLFERSSVRTRAIIINSSLLLVYFMFIFFKNRLSPILFDYVHIRSFNMVELWALFFNWYLSGNSIWTYQPYTSVRLDFIFQSPLLILTALLMSAVFLKGIHFLWTNDNEKKTSYGKEVVTLLFVLPVALLILTNVGFKKVYIERSCYAALPFFLIVLTAGVAGFKNRVLKMTAGILLIGIALASLVLFFKKNDQSTVSGYREDWRSVGKFFSDETKLKDGRFIIYTKTLAAEVLGYYLPEFSFHPRFNFPPGIHRVRFKIAAQRIARFLEQKYGKHNPVTESIEKNLQSDEWMNIRSSRIPRIEVRKTLPVPDELRPFGVSRFYVVESLGWSKNTPALIREINKINEFQFVRQLEFHGVRVYEFTLVE